MHLLEGVNVTITEAKTDNTMIKACLRPLQSLPSTALQKGIVS